MNGDRKTARDADPASAGAAHPAAAQGRPAVVTPVSEDSRIAIEVRGLVEQGQLDEARERFTELVALHQRRASRIAYQYLRDVAEADEAVQDAFVKVFSRIASYREAWPFEVWFTRILINGCLDRRKASQPAQPVVRRRRHHERSRKLGRPLHGQGRIPRIWRSRVSGAPGLRTPSTGSTAASARCSCCVTSATAPRVRSAR